jgi:hypothetical protein
MLFDKNAKRTAEDDGEAEKPASKFTDREYVAKTSLDHNGKRYAPGDKVHLTAAEAEDLAGVNAIEV